MVLMRMAVDFFDRICEMVNPALYLEKQNKCVAVRKGDDINKIIMDYLDTI